MLNWLKQYLPALVLVAFGIAILDGTASSFMTCHPITADATQQAHPQQQQECTALAGPLLVSLLAIVDFLDNHSETVTAIFTIVLAVFTGRLWYSTEGLFRVTKIVADADRPHMVPSELKISGIRQAAADDGKVKVGLTYRFTNYGRSPAFLKRYCLMFSIGDEELAPVPQYGQVTTSDFIIVVNGWWGGTEPWVISLTPEIVAQIFAGTGHFIIFGFIEYSDTAAQNHKMRFAYDLIFGEGDASLQFRPTGPDTYREYT